MVFDDYIKMNDNQAISNFKKSTSRINTLHTNNTKIKIESYKKVGTIP